MIEINIIIEEREESPQVFELNVKSRGRSEASGATKIECECAEAMLLAMRNAEVEFSKALKNQKGVTWVEQGPSVFRSVMQKRE